MRQRPRGNLWASVLGAVRTGDALPWVLLATFYVFTLAELRHAYLSKGFNYHDLGLISDFMTSVWHGRGLFHVYDAGINHLGWLFTPTMILLTPFHALCDSQFTLILSLTTAIFAGYALALALVRLLLSRGLATRSLSADQVWPWVGTLFALFAGLSTYCWKANVSVHYESLYLLFASATLFAVLKGARLSTILPLYILCLGTRPDAGLFLALQLASLLALPANFLPAPSRRGNPPRDLAPRRALARRIAALAAGGVLYTALVIKLISPAFGIGEKTHALRLWSHLGDSYGAIAFHILTNPNVLWDSLRGGAFLKLNQSLLLLPLLHPAGWIANLPGFIFYTTSDPSHRTLEFYNSAMLMPALLPAACAGLTNLQGFLERTILKAWPKGRRALATRAVLAALLMAAAFGAGFPSALHAFRALTDEAHPGGVTPEEGKLQLAWIRQLVHDCPGIRAVAADFQTSTFLPNRVGIALLRNARKADAVVFAPLATTLFSDAESLAEYERALISAREFVPFREGTGLKAFIRPGRCPSG